LTGRNIYLFSEKVSFGCPKFSIIESMKNIFRILSFLLILLSCQAFAQDITEITVHKQDRELELWSGENLYKKYNIKLSLAYNNPLFSAGPKSQEGDMQTPVGFYKIDKKRQKTHFPKSLLISYPNKRDKQNAQALGIPEDKLGGMILIHGNPYRPTKSVITWAAKLGISAETIDQWVRDYFYPFFDWTNGCIAVSDSEMDEIFDLVKKGTPIYIYP